MNEDEMIDIIAKVATDNQSIANRQKIYDEIFGKSVVIPNNESIIIPSTHVNAILVTIAFCSACFLVAFCYGYY